LKARGRESQPGKKKKKKTPLGYSHEKKSDVKEVQWKGSVMDSTNTARLRVSWFGEGKRKDLVTPGKTGSN